MRWLLGILLVGSLLCADASRRDIQAAGGPVSNTVSCTLLSTISSALLQVLSGNQWSALSKLNCQINCTSINALPAATLQQIRLPEWVTKNCTVPTNCSSLFNASGALAYTTIPDKLKKCPLSCDAIASLNLTGLRDIPDTFKKCPVNCSLATGLTGSSSLPDALKKCPTTCAAISSMNLTALNNTRDLGDTLKKCQPNCSLILTLNATNATNVSYLPGWYLKNCSGLLTAPAKGKPTNCSSLFNASGALAFSTGDIPGDLLKRCPFNCSALEALNLTALKDVPNFLKKCSLPVLNCSSVDGLTSSNIPDALKSCPANCSAVQSLNITLLPKDIPSSLKRCSFNCSQLIGLNQSLAVSIPDWFLKNCSNGGAPPRSSTCNKTAPFATVSTVRDISNLTNWRLDRTQSMIFDLLNNASKAVTVSFLNFTINASAVTATSPVTVGLWFLVDKGKLSSHQIDSGDGSSVWKKLGAGINITVATSSTTASFNTNFSIPRKSSASILVMAATNVMSRYDNVAAPTDPTLYPGSVAATDGSLAITTGFQFSKASTPGSPFGGNVVKDNTTSTTSGVKLASGRLPLVQVTYQPC